MKTDKLFNFMYSIGAAVVILGAMGKLMHYSWSDVVLQIALITEAGIFVLLGVQELFKKQSVDLASYPKMEGADNSELTKSVDNLNQTIKQIFNR